MAELKKCPVCGTPARMIWHGSLKFSVEALPTVEVVRCKDCKHRGTPYSCPMRKLVMPVEGPGGYEDCTEDDGFCHMGERKEAATEC